jgi:hypothetical protein
VAALARAMDWCGAWTAIRRRAEELEVRRAQGVGEAARCLQLLLEDSVGVVEAISSHLGNSKYLAVFLELFPDLRLDPIDGAVRVSAWCEVVGLAHSRDSVEKILRCSRGAGAWALDDFLSRRPGPGWLQRALRDFHGVQAPTDQSLTSLASSRRVREELRHVALGFPFEEGDASVAEALLDLAGVPRKPLAVVRWPSLSPECALALGRQGVAVQLGTSGEAPGEILAEDDCDLGRLSRLPKRTGRSHCRELLHREGLMAKGVLLDLLYEDLRSLKMRGVGAYLFQAELARRGCDVDLLWDAHRLRRGASVVFVVPRSSAILEVMCGVCAGDYSVFVTKQPSLADLAFLSLLHAKVLALGKAPQCQRIGHVACPSDPWRLPSHIYETLDRSRSALSLATEVLRALEARREPKCQKELGEAPPDEQAYLLLPGTFPPTCFEGIQVVYHREAPASAATFASMSLRGSRDDLLMRCEDPARERLRVSIRERLLAEDHAVLSSSRPRGILVVVPDDAPPIFHELPEFRVVSLKHVKWTTSLLLLAKDCTFVYSHDFPDGEAMAWPCESMHQEGPWSGRSLLALLRRLRLAAASERVLRNYALGLDETVASLLDDARPLPGAAASRDVEAVLTHWPLPASTRSKIVGIMSHLGQFPLSRRVATVTWSSCSPGPFPEATVEVALLLRALSQKSEEETLLALLRPLQVLLDDHLELKLGRAAPFPAPLALADHERIAERMNPCAARLPHSSLEAFMGHGAKRPRLGL